MSNESWLEQIRKRIASRHAPADPDASPKSRRGFQWLLAGGIMLVILIIAIASVSLSQRTSSHGDMQQVDSPGDLKSMSVTAPGAGVSDRDVWITKSEGTMKNLTSALRALKQKVQTLQTSIKSNSEHATTQASENLHTVSGSELPGLPSAPMNAPASIPRMGPGSSSAISPITPVAPSQISTPFSAQPGITNGQQVQASAPPPDNGMLMVHLTPPPHPSKKKKVEDKSAWLAISFTPAQLLNGLDGATGGQAQQNPQPVLMQVTDMTQMPNRYQQDFKECFITAAGYGDISSERVYLRLEKLSCIDDQGHAIEETIDGYVTGEDGKVGMKGRLVSKQGQVLAKALLAGLASGIGTAFTQSLSTQSLSPLGATTTFPPSTAFRSGIYSGVGKALNKLANFYIKQAQKLYPVIEVDAGRSVDVIINKGIRLTQWDKNTQQ